MTEHGLFHYAEEYAQACASVIRAKAGRPDPDRLKEARIRRDKAKRELRRRLDAAQQPPAEAQPVAWEWVYIGGDHYPRGHKVARSLREMDPTNPPYPETWRPTRPLIYGDTAPPSAPVGVEDGVFSPMNACCYREQCRANARALAQQPAAVDEAMVERAAKELRDLHREFGDGADLPEKIAIEIAEAVLAAALAAHQGDEA